MKRNIMGTVLVGICLALIAAGGVAAQDSPFKSAGKGTLTPDTISEHPIMPWWMPAAAEAEPYQYRHIDMVAVSFATDFDKAAGLVPEDLDLLALPGMPGQTAVTMLFAKYRENDQTGPYMEMVVSIPVIADGGLYLYVAAIYVDNDAALIAGREFGGYPKKIADINIYNYGDLFLCRMSRSTSQEKTADPQFSDIATAKVARGGQLFSVPLPEEDIRQLPFPFNMLLPLPPANGKPQPYVLPTMGLRTIPGVGKDAKHAEIMQLITTPWVITNARVWAGVQPSIDLIANAEDPIAQMLPINMVLASFILRGDMYTDPTDWVLFRDYKKGK